jgi:peptide/nickel transport system substrate-binding protein
VVAVLVAAACSGGGALPDGNFGELGSTAPPLNRVLQPSERKGGTLHVIAGPGCESWDPQRVAEVDCWDRQRWVARQLLTYAPEPGQARLVGDLAEGVPSSTDLRTWTYRLRAGLRFEDGTLITSKDVKYGIERVFGPPPAPAPTSPPSSLPPASLPPSSLPPSSLPPASPPRVARGVVAGSPASYVASLSSDPSAPYPGPYADPDPERLGLASVATPDDRTITFHLARPFTDWNALMATPVSTPVPRAADSGADGGMGYGRRPVASGPYRMDTHNPGVSVSFVRNPQWDPETDPNRAALPDRIVVTLGLDAARADEVLLDGPADLRLDAGGVAPKLARSIAADATLLSQRALSVPTGTVSALALVTTAEPFDDVHCRRAVAWALDRAEQRDARGGPLAGGAVATTVLPPEFGYRPTADPYPSPGSRGDPAKATEELAACGMPGGFSVRLAAGSSPRAQAQAQAVVRSLARVGIKVALTGSSGAVDGFDVARRLGGPGKAAREGVAMALVTLGGAWPAPYPLFHSIVGGSKVPAWGDVAGFEDPEAAAALEEGVAARGERPARAAWSRVEAAVLLSAAYVPLVHDRSLQLFSARVTNVMFSPPFANVDLSAVGVVP